jgi:hypothetical protein
VSTQTNPKKPTTRPQTPAGIGIVSSQLRSASLERDSTAERLGPIHVGVRVQDMLERVTAAIEDSARTRAWSLTGPYGTGKSTLALLIDALLGQHGGRRAAADALLSEATPTLAERLTTARRRRAAGGFITAVATARREPLLNTVARALHNGARRTWPPGQMPLELAAAFDALDGDEPTSSAVLAAVKAMAAHAPTFLIIDEFGKTLEHLASQGEFSESQDDVFLLQELAEAGAGARGLPLFILTLQHMSFGDYASRTTNLQRREWAKVQGRFEDITMTTHLGDAVSLIQRTLDHTNVTAAGRKLIAQHAGAASEAWAARGLDGTLTADAAVFEAVYPLHPLTIAVAPMLAGQVGQHDRSLTGFIAGDEPHTVQRFLLKNARSRPTHASTVRLPEVYDFFLSSGRTTVLASTNASRWIEIDTRITEANGLPEADQEVLKTVGLLNLVDSSGALRASADMVLFALTDPADAEDGATRQELHDRINSLVERRFLVHREFSDEYRVWQGSDVDLGPRIASLIERCDDHTAVSVVNRFLPPAIVAGKHSQRTGMLRHFLTQATDAETNLVTGPEVGGPADGLLIFHFGTEETTPAIDSALPSVVGISHKAQDVLGAARYLHALEELTLGKDLDAVARRELAERLGQANAELAARLAEAFSPNLLAATWSLTWPGQDGATGEVHDLSARSLAGIVSLACDRAYPHTPAVRNEMLGRHQLTSQGAKARRELMEAMLSRPGQRYLGIQGYGPERAMYSGVVEFLGLHRPTSMPSTMTDDTLLDYAFAPPMPGAPLSPAWAEMQQMLKSADTPLAISELYARLAAPPYGVKAGVVPLLILAALIIGEQDIAVFEEGTYQPRLSEALIERMVKAPDRFAAKAMNAQGGTRKTILSDLADVLDTDIPQEPRPGARNAALLTVARELLDRTRTLTPYADRHQEVSAETAAVRSTLKKATQPDTLIFKDLPVALGLKPIALRGRSDKDTVEQFAGKLGAALDELASLDKELRTRVVAILAEAFRLPNDLRRLRNDLAAQTRGLTEATLVESRLRGLIAVTHDASLPDDEWLDPVVVRIVGRGMNDWRDQDEEAFAQQAKTIAKALDRVNHLWQSARLDETGDPFTAHVITLTSSDGREEHAVVHVPDAVRDTANRMASEAITNAKDALGPQGERIFLALLAQQLIAPPEDESPEQIPTLRSNRKKAVS